MKKFNLQLFAGEVVQGKQIVYLYRLLSEANSEDATQISFVTENTFSKSKDSETTITKDGSIRTPGEAEIEIGSTSLFAKGDAIIDKLEQAMDNNELLEIWRVNLAEPAQSGQNKFKAKYFQGYLTEFEETSSSEEAVEYSHTFGINGNGVNGEATVTPAQQEMANYVFADTQSTGA